MSSELQKIESALKNYLPDSHKISAIRSTADGFSNRTFLLEGLDLMLRLPPVGEPMLAAFGVYDVVGQYRIMEEFFRTEAAPAVARPELLELDTKFLGYPFFIMEWIECDPWGDLSRPDWLNNADASFRSGVSEQLVQTYVDLHALAPMASMGPPRSSYDELKRWQEPIAKTCGHALARAFDILLDSVPDAQAPAPCHGDAKAANLLWKNGRIAAIVDYEMSFNGDPRWDLAALLQTIRSEDGQRPMPMEDEAGFWGQEHIISQWQAGTGRGVDRLDWFKAADRARYSALLFHGQRLFDTGQNTDQRLGTLEPIAARLADTALALAVRDAERA